MSSNQSSYIARTSGVQLPSAVELLDILKKESQRKAVRLDYVKTHPEVFSAHKTLAKLIGVNDGWIDDFEKMPLDELVDRITTTHTAMARYISDNSKDAELLSRLFTSLVPDEQHDKSDIIFVFGSESNARIERAVELYKEGVAPEIILSGKGPHYRETHESEAERMAKFAIEAGVPEDALMLENASVTLPDNVKRTFDLLETRAWRPQSVTIIATNFVLRRAVMEWYKFAPWDIQIHAVASRTKSPYFTPTKWHEDAGSLALILNEYAKLVLESKIDLMRSTE